MSDEQTRLLHEILEAVKAQTAVLKQYHNEVMAARQVGNWAQPVSAATREGARQAKTWIPVGVGVACVLFFLILGALQSFRSGTRDLSKPIIVSATSDLRGH